MGRGETWRREAEDGIRILDEYGEGGSRPATEVIEEVNRRRGRPGGSKVLLTFLKDFEKKALNSDEKRPIIAVESNVESRKAVMKGSF